VDRHYYSVPYQLAGHQMEARFIPDSPSACSDLCTLRGSSRAS
jgi:hypothetical protein